MKAPPLRLELCGSTSASTACTATAASAAVPPLRSIARPARAASGLAATTIAVRGPPATGAMPFDGIEGAEAAAGAGVVGAGVWQPGKNNVPATAPMSTSVMPVSVHVCRVIDRA